MSGDYEAANIGKLALLEPSKSWRIYKNLGEQLKPDTPMVWQSPLNLQ